MERTTSVAEVEFNRNPNLSRRKGKSPAVIACKSGRWEATLSLSRPKLVPRVPGAPSCTGFGHRGDGNCVPHQHNTSDLAEVRYHGTSGFARLQVGPTSIRFRLSSLASDRSGGSFRPSRRVRFLSIQTGLPRTSKLLGEYPPGIVSVRRVSQKRSSSLGYLQQQGREWHKKTKQRPGKSGLPVYCCPGATSGLFRSGSERAAGASGI